ncbi:MAG: Crp/Fnr family transcriptional regulator [Alphaproteobacteria bacterium]|uniref:Crp/Fnr family transcriptional regulator n=1 Tax=Candidatus Nitrobium versatile TaxID=2884831 RepID=A0A953JB13_9BACT|nr:Crp/Fnr family transcriptional regulator [Candidatus Nitrobium versatile]
MEPVSINIFRETFTLFRDASPSLIEDILSASRRLPLPGDTLIYSEGDSCSGIAFLLSGSIRVYKSGDSGREITLYEIGRGETCILNASCILSEKPYPAHAYSTEGGEMLLLPSDAFRRMIARHEEMRDFIFSLLSERLVAVMALVEEVAFGRMDERILAYLTEKAEEGIVHTTHQKIANDLGTSREVVSRLLRDLERKGCILHARSSIRLLKR